MSCALLVGNGFTSHLIKEYTNSNMMSRLREQSDDIYSLADSLFSPLRSKTCDHQERRTHIIETLNSLSFCNSEEVYQSYFINSWLISEIKYEQISSVESLLKIVSLFGKKGKFSDNEKYKILKIANQLYFNGGNNGLNAIPDRARSAIASWLSSFKQIFTTNFDFVLDEASPQGVLVKHLHGGFQFKSRDEKCDHILSPEESYLVWGINGLEKAEQTQGPLFIVRNGALFTPKGSSGMRTACVLSGYLSSLRDDKQIEELDIFGYSGENDDHINRAIATNTSIKNIRYYCNPKDVDSKSVLAAIKERFYLTDSINLSLVSWNEVWDKIPLSN